MPVKKNIIKLRENIALNINYLSSQYEISNKILSDLNRIISLDMSSSLMFQWWVENENSINIINELLEDLKCLD